MSLSKIGWHPSNTGSMKHSYKTGERKSWPLVLRAEVVLSFAVLIIAGTGQSAVAQESSKETKLAEGQELLRVQELRIRAKELVVQLGGNSFEVRAKAARELAKMGEPALPILEKALEHPDREIRERAIELKSQIQQRELLRKIDQFENAKDPDRFGVPGWKKFKAIFAEESKVPSNRVQRVYARIIKSEYQLFLDFENRNTKDFKQIWNRRFSEIYSSFQSDRGANTVGTVAGVFFLASLEELDVSPAIRELISDLFYVSAFREAITNYDETDPVTRLVEKTVITNSKYADYQCLRLGRRFRFPSAIERAKKVISKMAVQPYIRQEAFQVFATLGSEKDVEFITGYFSENAVVGTSVGEDSQRYITQLGDVALATCVALTDKKFKEYGFDRVRFQADRAFVISSLGFLDNDDRLAAQARWKKVQASNK